MREDSQCTGGSTCNLGTCLSPPDAGVAGPVGAACMMASDCGPSGWCTPSVFQGQPTGWVDGYCTQNCATTKCPLTASCEQVQVGDGGIDQFCFAMCMSDTQCRTGYLCQMGLCLPP